MAQSLRVHLTVDEACDEVDNKREYLRECEEIYDALSRVRGYGETKVVFVDGQADVFEKTFKVKLKRSRSKPSLA